MMIGDHIPELQRRVALYDDERAYKELFFTFYTPLVRFALSFVHERESAEEVVSDVLIKVWIQRKTIHTISNLRVYLYVSTRNTALNCVAKQSRRPIVSLDSLDTDFVSSTPNPEQIMITAEMVRRINSVVQSLPPRCKLVFRLVREEGLPYKEVSQILNISIKTIDNQMAVALRKISQALNLKLSRNVKPDLK